MPAPSAFDYAIVRVVPRVDRGEQMNAGVILHCRALDFLGARIVLDRARLGALWPDADANEIERHLEAIVAVAEGRAEAGPIALLPPPDRFHWLVAPRSTVIQMSPVHSGLCEEPRAALEHLFRRMVG